MDSAPINGNDFVDAGAASGKRRPSVTNSPSQRRSALYSAVGSVDHLAFKPLSRYHVSDFLASWRIFIDVYKATSHKAKAKD